MRLLKIKHFLTFFKISKVTSIFLQDCGSPGYKEVNFWLGNGQFRSNPLSESVDEYLHWIDCQLEFVKCRNERIKNSISA